MAVQALLLLSAFQGYTSFRQAQQQNQQLRFQALIAEQNAGIARREGRLAREVAFRVEIDSRRQTEQLLGIQRTKMAASGFVVGEGTFGVLLDETAILGEADALAIQYEGELEQFRKEREAVGLEQRAGALRASTVDPFLVGATGFLGSAGTSQAIRRA